MDQQGKFVLHEAEVDVDAVAGGVEEDVEGVGPGVGGIPGEEEHHDHAEDEGGGGDHEAIPQLNEVLHDREIGFLLRPDKLLGPLLGVDDRGVSDHVS